MSDGAQHGRPTTEEPGRRIPGSLRSLRRGRGRLDGPRVLHPGRLAELPADAGADVLRRRPLLPPCKRRFRRFRLLRQVLLGLLVLAGALFVFDWVWNSDSPFRLWFGSFVVSLFGLPVVFWELFFPPSFDLMPYPSTVSYEFRDEEYAEEFAALNGGEVE